MNYKRLSIILSLLVIFCLPSFAQVDSGVNDSAQTQIIDIFDLPSCDHITLTEGMGYFPVLHQLGGNLVTVLRAGGGHMGRGGSLMLAKSVGNAKQWTPFTTVVNSPEDDRNPALGVTQTGRIVVAYHEQGSYTPDGQYDSNLKRARAMVTYSDNQGQTWSAPKPLGIEGLESASPYGRIEMLSDGTLLMNVYGPYTDKVQGAGRVNLNFRDYAYLVRSRDNGETWTEPNLISAGHNETAILPVRNGFYIAASRSEKAGYLSLLRSTNGGKTWSEPMRLTNAQQHPGDLLRLSNGWILLLFGDRSVEAKQIRGMISKDEGRTWEITKHILFSRPVRGDFGYPSGVLANGQISVIYYWAGPASDAYDGSQARSYLTLVNEAELIQALN